MVNVINKQLNLRQLDYLILTIITLLLVIMAQYNYLLFHSLIEIFTSLVLIFIFILSNTTYKYSRDDFLLFIGYVYVSVSVLNIFHLLSYNGMSVFRIDGANVATQLWISSRYLGSLSILLGTFIVKKMPPFRVVGSVYFLITSLLLVFIFIFNYFPECYREGEGLTPFKIYSEYLIALIQGLIIYRLFRLRGNFNPSIWFSLITFFIINIAVELCFTQYISVYGQANLLGHLLRFIAVYLMYKGIIAYGLENPYHLIFQKLKQRNEDLESMSRYKSDFLANVSHEMRTPLTIILGYCNQLQQEKNLEKQQFDDLREISSSAHRLLEQVNDLLDMARLESGRLSLDIRPIEPDKLCVEVVKSLNPMAKELDITIHTELKVQGFILGDISMVKMVCSNLLTNAIKYSPKGKCILLKSYWTNTPTEGIMMEVKDSGQGIPQSSLEMIFEPFYQVPERKNNRFKGTGLGLAIVKKIVEVHNGSITVHSEEGNGTTFCVFLPKYPLSESDLI